nr:hypothetical protein [Tanacetum cinerariifolium]
MTSNESVAVHRQPIIAQAERRKRYIKASLPSDNEVVNMAFFFTELSLMDYLVNISINPSKLAASAVYAARCTLNKTPAWIETLRHYTGYAEDQIRDCAKILVSFHACASETVYAARCMLNKTPAWTETLRHYTGYAEDQIRDCAKILVSFYACASESKLKEVYEKYVNPDRGAVALFPPATSLWLGCYDSAL